MKKLGQKDKAVSKKLSWFLGVMVLALMGVQLLSHTAWAFPIAANMATVRSGHTATLLPNGNILVAGGSNGSVIFSSADLYDSAIGSCGTAGLLTEARYQHTSTLLPSGKVLIAGGG